MSVEFSNTYQEILLDNLFSIIKQNILFQTQLKLAEEAGKSRAELQTKYEDLIKVHEALKTQLIDAESYKAIAVSNETAHEEKTRMQTALNDIMKKNTGLQKTIEIKNAEINALKEYISKLENIAPASKLKKVNPEKFVEEKPVKEPAPNDLFTIKANDGSSF